MNVREALESAKNITASFAGEHKSICAAYIIGSAADSNTEDLFPLNSDIDIMLVSSVPPGKKPGKIAADGLVVELSLIDRQILLKPESILGSYHVAHGLRKNTVIFDNDGALSAAQNFVEAHFFEKKWVAARRDDALNKSQMGFEGFNFNAPYYDRMMSLAFSSGIICHAVLAADMKNPTVRKRFVAAKEVLAAHGCDRLYDNMIEAFGVSALTKERALFHLNNLSYVFDSAILCGNDSYPFSSDISDYAKHIAIDGSMELIELGLCREAMFWIAASFSRCFKILADDSPEEELRYKPMFVELARDMGIDSAIGEEAFINRNLACIKMVRSETDKWIMELP